MQIQVFIHVHWRLFAVLLLVLALAILCAMNSDNGSRLDSGESSYDTVQAAFIYHSSIV